MYSEEALRVAYKDIMESFAALGADLEGFPTIEEFRIAYEEELKANPPREGEDFYLDDGDDEPRRH